MRIFCVGRNYVEHIQELNNEKSLLSLLKERDASRNRIWGKIVKLAPELENEAYQTPEKKIGNSKPWMLAAAVILLAITGFLAYRLLLGAYSVRRATSVVGATSG